MGQTGSERSSRMPGFYKLDVGQRLEHLDKFVHLTPDEKHILRREPLSLSTADMMTENVVGIMGMPLGLGVNFRINERDYVVPMVVEEPSVVAAASHMAKLLREHGRLTAEADEPVLIGQIQVTDVPDIEGARAALLGNAGRILALANAQDPVLATLGGGAKDIEVRTLDTNAGRMIILHLLVDVRDAMGANAVNTMAEAIAPLVETLTGGKVLLRIISNLADHRLARAKLTIAPEGFSEHGREGRDVADGIVSASAFASADPYRAATHNKGIMNGVDALLLATGNDWRAVEAGAHAYACRSGRYSPLSHWIKDPQGDLAGEIELPMSVGIVGGATKANPTARIALKILGVNSARELAAVATAVGLVQNLAALRSLVAEGIQRGHMILHARSVAISAGAVGDMAIHVASQMVREGTIGMERAKEIVHHLSRLGTEALKLAHEGARGLHQHVDEARKRDAQKQESARDDSEKKDAK